MVNCELEGAEASSRRRAEAPTNVTDTEYTTVSDVLATNHPEALAIVRVKTDVFQWLNAR